MRLTHWSPDNTQDWFLPRDHPSAVCASIIKEIDVVIPEPTSMLALLAGIGGILLRRKSR
ncbi:MAG: PEP-CTERM sorting domain-containing protein [Armatimonadota bacterium]